MPPEGEPPLADDEHRRLLAWLESASNATGRDSHRPRDPGPLAFRRLNLAEYDASIRSVLGFKFHAAEAVGLPDEAGVGNAYGNLATALEIPPAMLEKYFAAADKALDIFLGLEDTSGINGEILEAARLRRGLLFGVRPNRWPKRGEPLRFEPETSERPTVLAALGVVARAAYRRPPTSDETARLAAIYDRARADGADCLGGIRLAMKTILVSPRFLFRIDSSNDSGSATGDVARLDNHSLAARLSYFLWSAPPDAPLSSAADAGLLTSAGPSPEPTQWTGEPIGSDDPSKERDKRRQAAFDDDLATCFTAPVADGAWIGLDLGTVRVVSRLRFSAGVYQENSLKGGRFQASPTADFSSGVVDLLVLDQAPEQAWQSRDLSSPESGPREPYRYVRYLGPRGSHGRIAEFEVWGPAEGSTLELETRRLLMDPRAKALTENFFFRWLSLDKLPTARPSTEFFPTFNADVRKAMSDEAAMFLDRLRTEDRGIVELLDSDYAYLNEDLAKYYGVPDVAGKEFRRVALKPEYHRGGLIGMGSILAINSHTSRTSPTLRGKWILDALFGAAPPPPPANAGMIKEEGGKGKEVKSFREQLARHAQQASCVACHRKMDPLGFALDNYNAAGVWRDDDQGRPIDNSGTLPDGRVIHGAADLKQVILDRKRQFVRHMIEESLTYALGRELDYFDDRAIDAIEARLERDGHRFSSLILGIVESFPFQYRRGAHFLTRADR